MKMRWKYLQKVADSYTVNGEQVTDKGDQHLMRLKAQQEMGDARYQGSFNKPRIQDYGFQDYTPDQMNIYNNYYTQQLQKNLKDSRFDNNINAATKWSLNQTDRYMAQNHQLGIPNEWTNPVTDEQLNSWGYQPDGMPLTTTQTASQPNNNNNNRKPNMTVKSGSWSRF